MYKIHRVYTVKGMPHTNSHFELVCHKHGSSHMADKILYDIYPVQQSELYEAEKT